MKKLILTLVGVVTLASSSLNAEAMSQAGGNLVKITNKYSGKIQLGYVSEGTVKQVGIMPGKDFTMEPPYNLARMLGPKLMTLRVQFATKSGPMTYGLNYDAKIDTLTLRKQLKAGQEDIDEIADFVAGGSNIELMVNRDGSIAMKEVEPKMATEE